MLSPALIIFIRNPERVQTSLAIEIGNDASLNVYTQLLDHTRAVTEFFAGDKYLFYSDYPNWNDSWDISAYHKRIQEGDNMGQRIQAAFASVFEEGYDKAIIIGSDCYELSLQHINSAVTALDTCDVVIGPAQGAGYYLLGMRTLQPAIFTDIQWRSDKVQADTPALLHQSHLSYKLLPVLHNLHNAEDLARSGLIYQ